MMLNEKGGVAKTTLAATLAAGLAMRGQRVMAVDCDPQGTLSIFMGVAKLPGLYQLVVSNINYNRVLLKVPTTFAPVPDTSLYIVPSDEATMRIYQDTQPDDLVLRRRLLELDQVFDVVILDTPPSPSQFHTVLYMAADYAIYPVELARAGLEGLAASWEHLENAQRVRVRLGLPGLSPLAVVPTRCSMNTVLHNDMLLWLVDQYGDLVADPLPHRIAWQEATHTSKSIFAHALEEKSAGVAAEEANRFVEKIGELLDV